MESLVRKGKNGPYVVQGGLNDHVWVERLSPVAQNDALLVGTVTADHAISPTQPEAGVDRNFLYFATQFASCRSGRQKAALAALLDRYDPQTAVGTGRRDMEVEKIDGHLQAFDITNYCMDTGTVYTMVLSGPSSLKISGVEFEGTVAIYDVTGFLCGASCLRAGETVCRLYVQRPGLHIMFVKPDAPQDLGAISIIVTDDAYMAQA